MPEPKGINMPRIHIFEFTDQTWYPDVFRRIQTDYLQFAASLGTGHKNLIPLFRKALTHAQTMRIVDLCSGGSGPWKHLVQQLTEAGLPVTVTLTDLYPHPMVAHADDPRITYHLAPVDATSVPVSLTGMRTLFEGFHHFQPPQAKAILLDAARKQEPIGIFEASLKPPFGPVLLVLSPLITLLTYLLVTPFIRPVTLQRLLFTYLIPLVPLATCWDGVVSMLRGYTPAELRTLAAGIDVKDYIFEAGTAPTGTPVFEFTYLIGYPEEQA
jgi:hypothetical protein